MQKEAKLRSLEVILQWALVGGRVLRRGSKKGLSRRHLEGRSPAFQEYDPFRLLTSYRLEMGLKLKMARIWQLGTVPCFS